MAKKEEIIYTHEELQKQLIYWQTALHLQEWDIIADIYRAKDMREGCAAAINWSLPKKMAWISILDPIDYPEDVQDVQDMEESLVHELLHIHLAPIHDKCSEWEEYELFEEWAINPIAKALITLERNDNG